jgi:hypothetical protein
MFNRTINKGVGANNRSGDAASAIWDLINDLVTEHNAASANTVNIFRWIPPSEWPAIVARTSTYDCSAALNSAINSQTSGSSSSAMGAHVTFPWGRYRFASTINLKRGCGLIGLGSGLTGGAPVEFVFDAGVTGIIVNRHDTFGTGIEASSNGADASLLVGLTLTGAGYSSSTAAAHGVVLRARAKCVGVICRAFKGDGFRVVASAVTENPERRGNANLFYLENCAGNGNWGSGLFVDGADANAGSVIAFNSVNNGRYGIWDNSFLGNTYLGCHVATNGLRGQVFHAGGRYYLIDDELGGSTEPGANPAVWVYLNDSGLHGTYPQWISGSSYITGGAYKSDSDTAVNIFLGCYSESGQPPSDIIHPAQVIGGLHGAGFLPNSSAFRLVGRRATTLEIQSPRDSGVDFVTQFSRRTDEAMAVVANGDHPNGLQTMLFDHLTGDWLTRHARLSARTSVRYTTDLSNFAGGRSAPVGAGHIRFPRGCFIGDRFVDAGTAAPTTGEWARGDKRLNSAPSAGGFVGWVCTTGGTPGTWKGYGAIEP